MAEPGRAGLAERVRPPQILLGVGAVLLVSAGAAGASAYGGTPVRVLLLALAGTAVALSVRAARTRLRSTEETLAACAAGLALAGIGGGLLDGPPLPPLLLAAGFAALTAVVRSTAAWPLAAWGAGQVAVLRALDAMPPELRTEVALGVSLVGLAVAVLARRVVARAALVTTGPWWLSGVVGGWSSAWTADGAQRWLAAVLVSAAAVALLPARLHRALDPLLGPPRLVPVVAGIVAGGALTGALSSLGTGGRTAAGYAGVLLASAAAYGLSGWRRGFLLPAALAGGITMTGLAVVQLVAGQRWPALSLLLLLTAVPVVMVAAHRPEDRPVAVPAAVGCLAGSALLALAGGLLGPGTTAVLLTGLYGAAMALGSALDEPATRRATAAVGGATAAAAVLVLALSAAWTALALHLLVHALLTLTWAWRTRAEGIPEAEAVAAWRVGAAQLAGAAEVASADAGLGAVEAYTLPVAVGLLIASGPRLLRGSSWRTWGPGLVVAAVPSTVLAVVVPDAGRAVAVLAVGAAAMVAGGRSGVRAPLLVGALSASAVPLGLAVRALPWQIGAALLGGLVLLAAGARRERNPVAGFRLLLAELR